jgi:hypothetical protein
MENRQMHRAILGLICLLGLVGAIATARAEDTVKIGLLMAYTGQFTDAAAQMDDGIKLYIKQHGDFVAGKRIELVRRDTAGAPDQAKRLAQELLVNDHVDILAGFVITPEALAVAQLATEAKKLMVVMNHPKIALYRAIVAHLAAELRSAWHLGCSGRRQKGLHPRVRLRSRPRCRGRISARLYGSRRRDHWLGSHSVG